MGKKGEKVRWNVAGRMATAWVFTLPSAGLVGALTYAVAHGIGGTVGVVVLFIALVAMAATFFGLSLKSRAASCQALR